MPALLSRLFPQTCSLSRRRGRLLCTGSTVVAAHNTHTHTCLLRPSPSALFAKRSTLARTPLSSRAGTRAIYLRASASSSGPINLARDLRSLFLRCNELYSDSATFLPSCFFLWRQTVLSQLPPLLPGPPALAFCLYAEFSRGKARAGRAVKMSLRRDFHE